MTKNMNIKALLHFSNVKASAVLIGCCSLVVVFAISSDLQAQKFDLEAYLKKIDVDRNGRLDENEMSDRTKGWISKMGFDTSKTISVSKILSKVAKDKRDADKAETSKARASSRKVPGFGGSERETTSVARFGGSESKSGSSKAGVKFSDSVMERVNSTLERYDRNKDGVLDKSEVKDARWGSPPAEDSDKNRDGRLSRDELAARYAAREGYSRSRNSRDSGRDSSSRKEAEDRARRERDRERFRNSGSTSSRSSSRRPTSNASTRSSSSSSSSSSADSQAKYKKYAESLIGNYDKDKDGKLNKDEIKQMRRPPVGADADKDGFITQEELLDSLSGANKSTTKVTVKSDSGSDGSRSSRYDRRSSSNSRSSSGRSGTSSSFDKLDSNADRHVQMHEFSTDWDEEKIAQFYAKDKNGDGVITLEEWSRE